MFGIDIRSGMVPQQNYWDMTGFRFTPVARSTSEGYLGEYWDGSTVFPQSNYTSSWAGTPRNSETLLTVTELAGSQVTTQNLRSLIEDECVTGIESVNLY